jgi:hypothetical protein
MTTANAATEKQLNYIQDLFRNSVKSAHVTSQAFYHMDDKFWASVEGNVEGISKNAASQIINYLKSPSPSAILASDALAQFVGSQAHAIAAIQFVAPLTWDGLIEWIGTDNVVTFVEPFMDGILKMALAVASGEMAESRDVAFAMHQIVRTARKAAKAAKKAAIETEAQVQVETVPETTDDMPNIFAFKLNAEYEKRDRDDRGAHLAIWSSKTKKTMGYNVPVDASISISKLKKMGLSSTLDQMCQTRYGFAALVMTPNIKPIEEPKNPPVYVYVNNTPIRTCRRCKRTGMFTTIVGGNICDDCI